MCLLDCCRFGFSSCILFRMQQQQVSSNFILPSIASQLIVFKRANPPSNLNQLGTHLMFYLFCLSRLSQHNRAVRLLGVNQIDRDKTRTRRNQNNLPVLVQSSSASSSNSASLSPSCSNPSFIFSHKPELIGK